jgi:hypothetical protein
MLNQCKRKVGDEEIPRFSAEAIEFQLEHVDASMAAKYNRDQRLPERVQMLQFWADMVDGMRKLPGTGGEADKPSNIVPMRAA